MSDYTESEKVATGITRGLDAGVLNAGLPMLSTCMVTGRGRQSQGTRITVSVIIPQGSRNDS
jgi:hypothetical protein